MGFELRDIHKHFGPVRANNGVNLSVESGELHGLLGENGAGKSTLMKVLSGFHQKTSGDIIVDGNSIELGSPADAITHGIGMLHQDPLVFLPYTVLDNFLIGSPGPERVDRKSAAAELATLADRFEFSLRVRWTNACQIRTRATAFGVHDRCGSGGSLQRLDELQRLTADSKLQRYLRRRHTSAG